MPRLNYFFAIKLLHEMSSNVINRYTQRRLRSAWAYAQADLRLGWVLEKIELLIFWTHGTHASEHVIVIRRNELLVLMANKGT